MKIADAAIIITDKLTTELKSIIKQEGHVKSGFMLNSSEVRYLTNSYGGKTQFVFSIKAPFYFKHVEATRLEKGKQTMLQMIKASAAYKESIEIFSKAILEQFGKAVLLTLKGKKEFKEVVNELINN